MGATGTMARCGHGRVGRLHVAALVNCRAADRLVNSASPRAAAPGSLAVSADGPPTGAQRQPAAAFVRGTAARACAAGNERHTAGGGGTAAGARRAPPGAGSPLSVSTRARGSPLAGAGCAGACQAGLYTARRLPCGQTQTALQREHSEGKGCLGDSSGNLPLEYLIGTAAINTHLL
jgi:hypothetical protein